MELRGGSQREALWLRSGSSRDQGAQSGASWRGKQVFFGRQVRDTGLYRNGGRKPPKSVRWMVSLASVLKPLFMIQDCDYLFNYVSKLRIEWDTADRVWKLFSGEFCLQLWWLWKIPHTHPLFLLTIGTWVPMEWGLVVYGGRRSLGLHLCLDRFNICLLTASMLFLRNKWKVIPGWEAKERGLWNREPPYAHIL